MINAQALLFTAPTNRSMIRSAKGRGLFKQANRNILSFL